MDLATASATASQPAALPAGPDAPGVVLGAGDVAALLAPVADPHAGVELLEDVMAQVGGGGVRGEGGAEGLGWG